MPAIYALYVVYPIMTFPSALMIDDTTQTMPTSQSCSEWMLQ